MSSLRSLVGHARSTLANSLARLRRSFDSLRSQVCHAIGRITGEVVADAVQEGVHAFLGSMHRAPPARYIPDRRFADPLRDEPRWHDTPEYADPLDDPFWVDDEEPSHPTPPEEESKQPSRESAWTRATAAGCSAAAWWLRRHPGRFSFLTALGVGLAASVCAFACDPLLTERAGAAASAFELLSLTNAARSGAVFLGG
jgi:hypothetical protein